jgi:hypothetical protein
MKMTDMRAKARAIFGPAIAEPMPNQPNGAKALQERANARPIPTYKVGGSVKKSPPQPTAAEREADRKRREDMAKMKAEEEEANGGGGVIWIIIIVLILAIVGVSAANISRSLKAANAEGDSSEEEEHKGYWSSMKAWMWKNKGFVGIVGVFLVCYFVVVGYGTLMDIGVYEGYNPEQPIWFSHASHVCKNEIDCQYCHSSAAKSKHASIPSVNVCMNCHKGINKGPITGAKEIAKIYAAIGFDTVSKQYIANYDQKPIVWNKVHNLPDHVYFNHSQHVTVGKIDCKQCHGPVQTYEIQKQFAPLTMGWCINCHRKTEVKMEGNGYYTKIHEELSKKYGVDKLTAAQMGGLECGKCHY